MDAYMCIATVRCSCKGSKYTPYALKYTVPKGCYRCPRAERRPKSLSQGPATRQVESWLWPTREQTGSGSTWPSNSVRCLISASWDDRWQLGRPQYSEHLLSKIPRHCSLPGTPQLSCHFLPPPHPHLSKILACNVMTQLRASTRSTQTATTTTTLTHTSDDSFTRSVCDIDTPFRYLVNLFESCASV